MYQNFHYDRQNGICHLWDDINGYSTFPYQQYAYQIDPQGKHQTINGLKVKKVKSWSKEAEKHGLIFEHDVPVATRVLIDKYYESDEPSVNHRILIFDIEVEKAGKHSTPKDAANRITSVAYYFNGEYTCLLLDETGLIQNNTVKELTISGNLVKTQIKTFSNERSLLIQFLKDWREISPTIVTAWNGETYDIPYLYNRLVNVLGSDAANKLSPIGVVTFREVNKRDISYKIAGVSFLDYMMMYKKFTYNEEPSYALDYIAKKELKRGKYAYEGTLDDLYKNDINGFIEYNVTDVELIVALEKKKTLIKTTMGICHIGHVPYDEYIFSSRYLEGASLTYCKRNNLISFRTSKAEGDDDENAEGALVKNPTPGVFKYVIDLDLTSLYPSIIRTLNISPETIFGKVLNWSEDEWMAKVDKSYEVSFETTLSDRLAGNALSNKHIPRDDFWKFIIDNNLTIASNGMLFKKDKPGLIPSILTHWFNERKRLSKLAEEYGLQGNHEQYEYYDHKQLVQKIMLNTFYGVLLLPSFRFYNKDAGESITLTGQSVITFSMRVANMFCNSLLSTKGKDYVIASDTDSMFLSAYQFIKDADKLSQDDLVAKTLEFAGQLQGYINEKYNSYATLLHNTETHYLSIKQEMIALRGFFLNAKKRYALWIINKKGVPVDELEIKGLDVVRSSFPKIFRHEMKGIIYDILHDTPVEQLNQRVRDFKKTIKQCSLFDVMKASSVKELSKYEGKTKSVPIHNKSAQNYNKLLRLYKIESIPNITDNDKILYVYLKKNPFGFESIALKGQGEDPPELIQFAERFVDRDTEFQSTYLGKLETIWLDLGWGQVELTNPQVNDFF